MNIDVNAVIEILPTLGVAFGIVFGVILVVWGLIAAMTKILK